MNVARLFVIVLTVSAGFILGMLDVGSGKSTSYQFDIWNYPGSIGNASGNAVLNCGWHNICTSGSDGDALDWRTYTGHGHPVHWRSNSTNSQGLTYSGSVLVTDDSSGSGATKCYRATANLRTPAGTALGAVRFVHINPVGVGNTYWVWSGYWPASTTFQIGTAVHNDCGLWLAHLHQAYPHGASWWARNNIFPTRATCWQNACQTYSSPWTNWQFHRYWFGSY